MRTVVRLAGLLRFEDLLMALLAVILLPALDRWLGAGSAAGSSADPTVAVGLLGLVAVGGVVACVLTRGPDEPSPLADGRLTLQGWARFPLAAGVGIVATETIPGLGFDPELLVGLAFVATFVGALAHPRLPVVPVASRRAMVLPMAILAAAAFDRIIGTGMGEMIADLVGGAVPAEVVAFWPLILGAAATMYAMLVVAPRAIADPGASGWAWTVRFVFLIGTIALATSLGIR